MVLGEETPLLLSALTIGQMGICEVALLFALSRLFLRWVFRLLRSRTNHGVIQTNYDTQVPSPPPLSQILRERCLLLTTFRDIKDRLPDTCDTCAVCLNQLMLEDEVREPRNCRHVFHKGCIDRWLYHDQANQNSTCPLCRAPLLTSSLSSEGSASCIPAPQPSWVVEGLIYLFGDDLPRC